MHFMSVFTQVVPPEVLSEASTDVLRFCECIQNIPDHDSHCGKLCTEIIALNRMLQQKPLDAFVLLPQIFCISEMADITDEDVHRHVFANHRNAKFICQDQHGNQVTKNIMCVLDAMKVVLIDLCQPTVDFTNTQYNYKCYLLRKLKCLIST